MSSKSLTVYNCCAFCRANGHPWNHAMKDIEDRVICPHLSTYKCPFCGIQGHTRKHCTKLAQKIHHDQEREKNQKQREAQAAQAEKERYQRWEQNQIIKQQEKAKKEQEKVRKEEEKSNSWASRVAKSVPEEVKIKIEQDEKAFKIIEIEQAKKRAEEKQQKWEEWYLRTMPKFYGLKEKYGSFRKGSFWEFFIEGKIYNGREVDHEIAKKLRDNEANQNLFIQYLNIKYFDWRYDTEGKEDDCLFVWRHREADRDFRQQIITDREEYQQEREREREQAEEKERAEMEYKLVTGEITPFEFQEWENAIEEDLIDALENYSARWYAIQEIESRRYGKWRNIKEEFESETKAK